MFRYPKIQTLFKRDSNFKVINEYRVKSLLYVKNILIMEKIDGTNAQIELVYRKPDVILSIFSRNNLIYSEINGTALISNDDIMYIKETIFKKVNLTKLRKWYFENFCLEEKSITVRLFGEVYGKGINTGYKYSNNRDIRIFDIQINNNFISFYKVFNICEQLELKTVPIIYQGESKDLSYEAIRYLLIENEKTNKTLINEGGAGGYLEGFIIKSEPLLLDEYGERVMAKIKREDF